MAEQITLPSDLKAALAGSPELPSLPASVIQIVALADTPDSNLQEFALAIEQDPALTIRLLALANSVFHAHDRPAETCHEAVTRLGIDVTLSVALGFGLSGYSGSRPPGRLDLTRFWQRALIGALTGHALAHQLDLPTPGRAFTIGLLQDIGMLALDACVSEGYGTLLACTDTHDALIDAERLAWGCDHAAVGAWLAHQWGLPSRLVDGIAASHAALMDVEPQQRCVNAAGQLADAWLGNTPSHLLMQTLETFGQPLGLADDILLDLLMHLQRSLPTIADLMHITSPPDFDPTLVLLSAKRHLHAHHIKLSQQMLAQQQELERLRRRHDALDQRVRFDALTGLYNRAHLETLLDEHFQRARMEDLALSVVFIDLDHFKRLNDRHGHRLGDEVLKGFATLLRELLSDSVLGGRYGGEEFLLLLPGAERHAGNALAQRLHRELAIRPLATTEDGEALSVSASIGIASLADGSFVNAKDLIHAADQGMYRAKRNGRGRIALYADAQPSIPPSVTPDSA